MKNVNSWQHILGLFGSLPGRSLKLTPGRVKDPRWRAEHNMVKPNRDKEASRVDESPTEGSRSAGDRYKTLMLGGGYKTDVKIINNPHVTCTHMSHFGSRGCSSSSETDAADVQEDHKVYLWPIKQKRDNLNTRDFGHEIQELHFKLEHNQHFNALMLIIVWLIILWLFTL